MSEDPHTPRQKPTEQPREVVARKSEQDKVSKRVDTSFTPSELDAIDQRVKTFKTSRSKVVRFAALGLDPPITTNVHPQGGIERVMSLADVEDYRLFKRASANLNGASRQVNVLARKITEALEGDAQVNASQLQALLTLARTLDEQATEMTTLARVLVKTISTGLSQ